MTRNERIEIIGLIRQILKTQPVGSGDMLKSENLSGLASAGTLAVDIEWTEE